MLLLLDLKNGAVLERPLDDIRLRRGALDVLALVQLGPELVEVLELDHVPNMGKRSGDDGRFGDGGRSGNARRHDVGWSVETIEV